MTEQEMIDAAEPPLDCRVGHCCYGGLKPKSACASCAAWSAADFATTLAAQQVPLGREFAEVLDANLWDLYESDTPVPNDRAVRRKRSAA